jgi:hypothetical protein
VDLPVNQDSLPLHVVGREPPELEREVAKLVVEQRELQTQFGGWMALLHPAAWEEVGAMARYSESGLTVDMRPAIKALGLKRIVQIAGVDRLIEDVGEKELIKRIGVKRFLANLSAKERRELKRRLLEEEENQE